MCAGHLCCLLSNPCPPFWAATAHPSGCSALDGSQSSATREQELIISSEQVINGPILMNSPALTSPGLVPVSLQMPKESMKNDTRGSASIFLPLGTRFEVAEPREDLENPVQMTVFCPSHRHPLSSHQLVAGRVPPAPSLHLVFSHRPSQTRMTSPETPNVPSVLNHHPASGSICPSAERSRSEGD